MVDHGATVKVSYGGCLAVNVVVVNNSKRVQEGGQE
jgi:hypothetical protein